jgi:hypothetical protein
MGEAGWRVWFFDAGKMCFRICGENRADWEYTLGNDVMNSTVGGFCFDVLIPFIRFVL